MRTVLLPNVQVTGSAFYGRPAWHEFVPQHPADCPCRRPDPWPGAPVVPPRLLRGAR